MIENKDWVIGVLWLSGASIGAFVAGALALWYFDRRLEHFVSADRDELLNDVRMAVLQSVRTVARKTPTPEP